MCEALSWPFVCRLRVSALAMSRVEIVLLLSQTADTVQLASQTFTLSNNKKRLLQLAK